jgi:hypothetical protein
MVWAENPHNGNCEGVSALLTGEKREMEDRLLDFIKSLKSDKSIESFDEAATKQAIILQCLHILGWNAFNVDEVHPEYSVGKDKVDYSLRLDDANEVFLEAKKVSEDLERERHQRQLLNYSFQQGVKLAILTNGVTWWFYLPLHEGDWEQRKFYSIDIYQQEAEDIASKFVDFLSRENIASGAALDNAEAVYKSQQRQKILQATLPRAWNMIVSEPDGLLVDLLNETSESICGYRADDNTIKRFLAKYRDLLTISVDLPEVIPPASPKQPQASRPSGKSKGSRKDSLLRLFSDIGGEGTRSQINERIPDYWELRPEEWKIKKGTAKPLYWHHVASACQGLKGKYEYLENPKRGTWRLTDKGRTYLKSIQPSLQKASPKAPTQQTPLSTPMSISENFTGKRISSFYFQKQKHEANSWKELLLGVCEVMNALHRNDFDKVFELKGSKRIYFTQDKDRLWAPRQIPNTDIFVETHMSATLVTHVCRRLIDLFGHSDEDLKIEIKPT